MTSRIKPPSSFVPGQWAGSYAAGTGGRAVGSHPSTPVEGLVKGQPVGESTAREFPWISSIFQRMPCVAAAGAPTWFSPVGTRLRFTRGAGEQSFYNNSNRPVKIDEIRIYSMPAPPDTFGAPGVLGLEFQIGRNVGLRLFTNKKEYVRDYLPLWQFQTESNRNAETMRMRGTFTFPTPYYLGKGGAFQLRTRTWYGLNPAQVGQSIRSTNLDFAFALQGSRENSTFPSKLMRQVVIPTAAATPANPLYAVIPFDENRDFPLTDSRITQFGLGIRDIISDPLNVADTFGWPWVSWVQAQFIPPQGPKWMADDDWVPLWGLLDQPGPIIQAANVLGATQWEIWDHSMIIHRPVTPYILQPREEMHVELRVLRQMDYSLSAFVNVPGWTEWQVVGIPFWCTMYGRQESLA